MTNANNTAATFDRAYELVGLVDSPAAKGLTLYEAHKALQEAAQAGRLTDGAHVRRGLRAVAFWCAWRHEVRAMFGAIDSERAVLADWA